MEGVWDWRYTENGGFLKMDFPYSFEEGGPGCTWIWGGGSSGPGIRAPQCAIPLECPPPGGFPSWEQW